MWRRSAGGARRDHGQGNAATGFVNFQNPNFDNVTDGDDIVRIANVLVGELADVHEAAVVQTNIDERAEIHDVEDAARQFHALRQVFELQHAPFEDWLW